MAEFLTVFVAFLCIIIVCLILCRFIFGDYIFYLIPAIINYIKNRKNEDDENVI